MIMGKSLLQQRYEVLSNRLFIGQSVAFQSWSQRIITRKAPTALQDVALTAGEAARPRR